MEETKNVVTNENFDWNAYENDLGVYDHPKEEIAEAYDKTLSNVNVGEVVEGTVTGITKREVLVNIGYKSEGVIPVSEFRYNPDLKVGDKIDIPSIGTVEVLANDALVAGQETAAENNGVVLLPERVVFTAENVADYNF